jgi:Domain of unknown function (DUF3597)
MSLFGKILEKLGFREEVTKAAVANAAAAAKHAARDDVPTAGPRPAKQAARDDRPAAAPPAAKPVAISPVDVVKNLEDLAAKNPQKLNWKVSIVDLLKLLGLESSYEARKDLATELGCPVDLMKESASMNTWLHKVVLRKIAENGGNIPKELLD